MADVYVMARLRDNFARGTLDLAASVSATNLTSFDFVDLDQVTSPDYIALTLDPFGTDGDPEIVWVTTHGTGATPNQNVTVSRAQEGTTARSHAVGTRWVSSPTAWDFSRASFDVYDNGNSGTSDMDIDPDNGAYQKYTATGNHTLGAAGTAGDAFSQGDSVFLEVVDGDLYTITLAAELIEVENQTVTWHDRNFFVMFRDSTQVVFNEWGATGT